MKAKNQKIIDSVLFFVPQEGWTKRAFDFGAKKSGIGIAEIMRLYPNGISDIATAFHQSINEAMDAKIVAKRNFKALRTRDKITFAVRVRLEAIEKNREAMKRLLVWSLLPANLRQSGRSLWQAADAIWIAAGDTSSDYNYYTKRALLIGVMKATLTFWLNDTSKNYQDTWDFLDRRIADVMVLGKGISVIKTVGISDVISLVRSRFAA